MDSLTIIIAIMTAIVFSWVGYFLGNFFPFLGKKRTNIKDNRISVGQTSPRQLFQRIANYFSIGEADEFPQGDEGQKSTIDVLQPKKVIFQTKLKDFNRLWYDKSEQKLYAEYESTIVDLDEKLTPEQQSFFSFLLLDLQEKVGISAKLRSVVSEREEEAFQEEDDRELDPPSFHPIKSFMQYVQADAPKLEEKPDSIPFQINEILQKKLKGTPLQSQGISINEWPEKGVVFIVGVEVYDEIEQIPNSQIRYVIQEAVKEWERRESED